MLKITLAFINHQKTIPSSRYKGKKHMLLFYYCTLLWFLPQQKPLFQPKKKGNHIFEIGLFLLFLAISINQKVKSEQVLFSKYQKIKGGFFQK